MTTTLTFRRPTVLPVRPQSWSRPPGSIDFRVTQRFDVPDYFYGDGRKHGAIDLGNFRCGDAVVAMLDGTARLVKDRATTLGAKTDALGVLLDHGHGVTSEYWHLNAFSVPTGATVVAGQQIGVVGRTGLGDVCHLHVEVKRNGVRIDPEPLIFGGSLTIEEDDVKIPAGSYLIRGSVAAGNRLRTDPATAEGSRITDKQYAVQVYMTGIAGEPYTLGGKPGNTYAWVGVFGQTWYVADPLLTDLTLTPTGSSLMPMPIADCSRQENALRAIRTAAAGARQAIEAVEGLAVS